MPIIIAIIAAIVLVALYLRSWNRSKGGRQEAAEAQRRRHGGDAVLEWDGPMAQGAPDGEFGALVAEVMKKSGRDSARFYERGLVIGSRRVAYGDLKDIVYDPGNPGKGFTPKQRMQNMAVMWIYPQKGMAMGIRDLDYRLDDETMRKIQKGLGYLPQ